MNWHWRHDELAYLITDSGSRVVFAHDDLGPGAGGDRAGHRWVLDKRLRGHWADPSGARSTPGTR